MPVLPLVGSIRTVSGLICPACSSASIIATPIRSLTEAMGLKNSSLASTVAFGFISADNRGSPTSGVSPIVSRIEANTLPRPAFWWREASYSDIGVSVRAFSER